MLKKVMKKFVWFFIFMMLVGIVCAGSWGDINDGENYSDEVSVGENISNEVLVDLDDASGQGYEVGESQFSEDSEKWTDDFYIALGFGVLCLLIVGLFIYFFLRGPKNKWEH